MSFIVSFKDFYSDSTDFRGDVAFEVVGNHLVRQRYGAIEIEFRFPDSAGNVLKCSAMSYQDAQYVFERLDSVGRQVYLKNSAQYLDGDRVQMLSFAKGVIGFIVLYETPDRFTFVNGDVAYECSNSNGAPYFERRIASPLTYSSEGLATA